MNKQEIEKYSRQIIIKNIGILGQKKILKGNVLVVGTGGLGCAVIDLSLIHISEPTRPY